MHILVIVASTSINAATAEAVSVIGDEDFCSSSLDIKFKTIAASMTIYFWLLNLSSV